MTTETFNKLYTKWDDFSIQERNLGIRFDSDDFDDDEVDVEDGLLFVDKSLFDDFEKNSVITIGIDDCHSDKVFHGEFSMTSENKDYITMSVMHIPGL